MPVKAKTLARARADARLATTAAKARTLAKVTAGAPPIKPTRCQKKRKKAKVLFDCGRTGHIASFWSSIFYIIALIP